MLHPPAKMSCCNTLCLVRCAASCSRCWCAPSLSSPLASPALLRAAASFTTCAAVSTVPLRELRGVSACRWIRSR